MKMTRAVAEYIKDQKIDIEKIEEKTSVSREKLCAQSDEALDGMELLEVCSYLGIMPEELWGKVK